MQNKRYLLYSHLRLQNGGWRFKTHTKKLRLNSPYFIVREAMHIHVRSAEGEAKFWLAPTVYLADSNGFDARTLRELRDVISTNKELIERIWNEYFA